MKSSEYNNYWVQDSLATNKDITVEVYNILLLQAKGVIERSKAMKDITKIYKKLKPGEVIPEELILLINVIKDLHVELSWAKEPSCDMLEKIIYTES